jgi:NAD(P)-dependent dehydrogenase (short-subunit alcohol dehydrogenase family)
MAVLIMLSTVLGYATYGRRSDAWAIQPKGSLINAW